MKKMVKTVKKGLEGMMGKLAYNVAEHKIGPENTDHYVHLLPNMS